MMIKDARAMLRWARMLMALLVRGSDDGKAHPLGFTILWSYRRRYPIDVLTTSGVEMMEHSGCPTTNSTVVQLPEEHEFIRWTSCLKAGRLAVELGWNSPTY
jgi:hypothetical protein